MIPLLKAGASTEARDCTGATPLCEAVFVDIVRLLREGNGTDVNARNAFGWTTGKEMEITTMMLQSILKEKHYFVYVCTSTS